MWEFSVPPHQGDKHFDLGIWHPSALPAAKKNRVGYQVLQRQVEEDDWTCDVEESRPNEAENGVQAFSDEVTALVDAPPDEDVCSRSWSIVLRCKPLFRLISLWPTVAIKLVPAIAESAIGMFGLLRSAD